MQPAAYVDEMKAVVEKAMADVKETMDLGIKAQSEGVDLFVKRATQNFEDVKAIAAGADDRDITGPALPGRPAWTLAAGRLPGSCRLWRHARRPFGSPRNPATLGGLHSMLVRAGTA